MYKKALLVLTIIVFSIQLISQKVSEEDFPALYFYSYNYDVLGSIEIENPSFEGDSVRGEKDAMDIDGWFDCGRIKFKRESPPDIHSGYEEFWGVTHIAHHGDTYIGMVARDNDSWESVSQKLTTKIQKNECYMMSAHMSQAKEYINGSRRSGRLVDYSEPIVLRIFGGNSFCNFYDLLFESEVIDSDLSLIHI